LCASASSREWQPVKTAGRQRLWRHSAATDEGNSSRGVKLRFGEHSRQSALSLRTQRAGAAGRNESDLRPVVGCNKPTSGVWSKLSRW
jgi:hypothetical protein